ncbi:ROK family protein [Alteromonas sp. C1M14]|uniref:ROK family protein n=1 Tax=Alteromonas sp. C1M14 TaxID=2841567 RepID=UPI001C0941E9|nr:ROK family protein [Alteromonas sp. C1M14]MBU2980155.1 ROK family protein [Alteromonas sp. C1M14]
MALNDEYYAVIEAGGTKFNCAIVNKAKEVVEQVRVPTALPEKTLNACVDFFKAQREAGYDFKQMGIGSFGPLDLNPQSDTYGFITKTPKPNWSYVSIAPFFADALNCDVVIDTDVNAAALAESRWGAAQGTDVCVYITVGTGVGGGVVIHGKPLHGLVHPEIGHFKVIPPDGIQGVCPFHGNCVEGLASGTSLGKIWGQPSDTLADDHPAWDKLTDVLAQLCHNLLVGLSAQRIIFGGGVMQKQGIVERIIDKTQISLNDYIVLPPKVAFSDIICLPGLGTQSGVLGALALLDT